MSSDIVVPGLDASSPLGFLAALGLLRMLEERAEDGGRSLPRLAFREVGRWRPVFQGVGAFEEILECVRTDITAWSESTVLAFRYLKVKKDRPERFGRLTPPVAVLRGWMLERQRASERGALEYMSALIAETATQPADEEDMASREQLEQGGIPFDPVTPLDRSCLQTPFDFSSRNMQFLDQIDCIRRAVADCPEWIEGELARDEPASECGRTMFWDTTAKVPGAQYPTRVTANRPTTEWLAFRGLVFLPVFGKGKTVRATACRGRRLSGEFIWPVWLPHATPAATRSLLAYPELESVKPSQLRALGVAQLFRSRFAKLGKYDAIFTPTEPVGGAVAPTMSAASEALSSAGQPRLNLDVARQVSAVSVSDADTEGRVDWSFSDDE